MDVLELIDRLDHLAHSAKTVPRSDQVRINKKEIRDILQSPDHARATSMPDTAWPIDRHPPGSSRGSKASPVSMSPLSFDTSSVVRSRSPS
jgi:hypothetical protein